MAGIAGENAFCDSTDGLQLKQAVFLLQGMRHPTDATFDNEARSPCLMK